MEVSNSTRSVSSLDWGLAKSFCIKMISYLHDFRLFVSSKELRYLARVKQTVDVFKERFFLDLCVCDEEHCAFTNRARLFQQTLKKYRKGVLNMLQ